ncbi:MAG: biotin--[acetyl-CoA-carboxylase] ligase [Microthrixaceae bacterium]|nr:biotin--[acetyl-CoA-carboxylase] ligase [Microthrixaceae bacterium]
MILVADHQTAGRGRLDRTWDAPPGSSILMTIGFPVAEVDAAVRTLLTMCLSLAVIDAIESLGIEGVSLKWPNDVVLVDGNHDADASTSPLGYRKFGGLLAELVQWDPTDPFVLVGLGLNINWGVMPEELRERAASLDELAGPIDRWDLITRIVTGFDIRWLPLLEAGEPASLIGPYSNHCSTLGERVRIEMSNETLIGTATEVTDTGALIVDSGGERHTITAGDLIHLRPE